MSPKMDIAVIESYPVGSEGVGNPTYAFVQDVETMSRDGGYVIRYIRNEQDRGTAVQSIKEEGRQFYGYQEDGTVLRFRPPVPEDAVRMGASVAQPIEVVSQHIAYDGGYLAPNLEAVVNAANTVLAVILRTGLGVYFRENDVWQLKRVDPRLSEGTTLQILAPDALEYWDDAEEPVGIYDLPYMVGNVRIDPDDRELADGPTEDDEEEVP